MKITNSQKLYLKHNLCFVNKLYSKFGNDIMNVVLNNFFIFNFFKKSLCTKQLKRINELKGLIINENN